VLVVVVVVVVVVVLLVVLVVLVRQRLLITSHHVELFDLKSVAHQIPELEVTPLFVLGHVNGIAHQGARL